MAEDGYFRHSSADGEAFSRRIARFYPMGYHHYWYVGENMLYSSSELDATAALKLWLNSPEHRAIMLRARWRDVGVGAVYARTAQAFTGGAMSRSSPLTLASAARDCEVAR